MKTAVITGVAGQDGSYLTELLLSKNYKVIGISRRKSVNKSLDNINHITNKNFILEEGDLTDPTFMSRLIIDSKPHEFYNLGAQSHVGYSFKNPIDTFRINAESVLMHLSYIKDYSPYTRYYQASTSEILGGIDCPKNGYTENFSPNPRSPYAVAKTAAHFSVKNFREAYSLYCCSGILFNHSSVRRGGDFATRKITSGIAKIKLGLSKKLKMGNLSAFRDEGCSKDYVKAMHLMLNNSEPKDYIVATGEGATIEEMFKYTCQLASLRFEDIYELDERFLRPSDVPYLLGNSNKIKKDLGWKNEYNWKSLLKEMYEHDIHNYSNKNI